MTNMYGFESTEEVKLDAQGLPVGTYKAMCVSEEEHTKDGKTQGVVTEWEIVDGANKGKKGKIWYNTLHSNQTTSNIAQQSLKRLAEASGTPITQSTPIKGRVVTLAVDVQKNNPQYTEVKKYLPESYVAAPF